LFIGQMALSLWDSYGLTDYEIGAGNISEDSRARWYINICVKLGAPHGPRRSEATKSVGIDLGLKDFASLSDGHVVGSGRHYRKIEGATREEESPRACASCKGKELTERPVAQAFHGACTKIRRHLHWQRERLGAREDTDGEVRARCGLERVPDHAAIQVRLRQRVVR
jgi:hypothetical protein